MGALNETGVIRRARAFDDCRAGQAGTGVGAAVAAGERGCLWACIAARRLATGHRNGAPGYLISTATRWI